MRIPTEQISFDFIATIDKELAVQAEAERAYWRKANADDHLHSNVEDLPPEPEEWDIILMGIRLCRHVHEFECQRCKLGCYNHCPRSLGTYWDPLYKTDNPIKVCLKDYFRWLAQHGLKSWVKRHLIGEFN
jgi:hypothetical protein